jgi:hypothetical protein
MTIKLLTTHNSERLPNAINEIQKLGYTPEIVYAIPNTDAKKSFNQSIKGIMASTNDLLLFFEDDVVIKHPEHFHDAIKQLPDNWECCYLGANLVAPIQAYSDNLNRTFGAWTTHAVMINNPKIITESYCDTDMMFDNWLKDEIHPRGNSYIIKPMIAWQSPHYSPLWDHEADYTDIFNASANKLI